MSYSCADFVDAVIDALSIEVPLESADSPSDQADLVLEELARRDASAEAMLAALKGLREWAALMGGWESAAWEAAESAIKLAEGQAKANTEKGTLRPGARVRLTEPVDNFPTCLIPAGETGTVTHCTDGVTMVRLDKHHPELAEWQNQLEVWHRSKLPLTPLSDQ